MTMGRHRTNRTSHSLAARRRAAPLLVAALVGAWSSGSCRGADVDTCLLYVSRNAAKDAGANAFTFFAFSKQKLDVKPGDVLEYDLLVGASNPGPGGGVDAWGGGPNGITLRDATRDGKRVSDRNGVPAHPAAEIKAARGRWQSRAIPLEALAGKTLGRWFACIEGDEPGLYAIALDNVRVRRADGSVVTVYDNGEPACRELTHFVGYCKTPALLVASRERVASAGERLGEMARRQLDRQSQIAGLDLEAAFLTNWLKDSSDAQAVAKLSAVQRRLSSLRNDPVISREQFSRSAAVLRGELAALALAGGRASSALAEAAATQPAHLTIDLAAQEGPATRRASGFLHGFSPETPGDDLVKPLKIQLFRSRWFSGYGVEASYERAKAMGAKCMVVLSCEIHDRRILPWPGEKGDWNDWERRVEKVASAIRGKRWDVQYDIWNEPNIGEFWGPGVNSQEGKHRWFETYRRGVRVVRRIDPKAVVVGPSTSGFDFDFLKEFLTYAKQNNCLPDVVSWHFAAAPDAAEKLREWMKDNGIDIDRISLNEYAGPEIQFKPGALVMQFAALERMKVDSACKSCWGDEGGSNCENQTLNGLVNWPERQPRSAWWAYKAYADVEGMLLRVSGRGAIDGVAAADEKDKKVRIVLGLHHSGGAGPHTLRLKDLDKAPWLLRDGRANLRALWIPDSGQKPLLRPVETLNGPVQAKQRELTITLPYIGNSDAYFVELSRPE